MDDYNKVVLDSGVFEGKRYIMPYDYFVPVLVTTQEILDAEGINTANLNTFDGFINTINTYNEKHKDNPKKSVFRNWQNNSSNLNNILPICGIDLIDYSANKVGIDKTKFKNIIDIMKPMYVHEEGSVMSDNRIEHESLKSQNWLFRLERYGNNISPTYQIHDMLVEDNLTPMYFKYPSTDNGLTAEVRFFAAIRKTSKNQISAYNLLKIILSKDIQTENMYIFGNPVLKSVVRTRADKAMSVNGLSYLKNEKSVEKYLDMLINVDSAKIIPKAPYSFIIDEMKPYWEGVKSFDDCYAKLVNKLEIYISE